MKRYIYSVMTDKRRGVIAFLFRIILTIASFFYGAIAGILKAVRIRSARSLPCKVISVGNLTLGGTGKTPFTCMVAKELRRMGRTPGVLIRGYGDDEWKMLKRALGGIPVMVGPDRISSGIKAHKDLGVDTAVLDDGFQHWRLKRDLDIVLIDATNPFGNKRLFPRGILRERISGLARADLAVLTKTDMDAGSIEKIKAELKEYAPDTPVLTSAHSPVRFYDLKTGKAEELSAVEGRRIYALSGIENTAYYEHTLKGLGALVAGRSYYPDHYAYGRKDLETVLGRCSGMNIDIIVTTDKDAQKLLPYADTLGDKNARVLVLEVELKIIDKEKIFNDRLHSLYSG
jgi:tetraacyldisaccharide 4'-kinase